MYVEFLHLFDSFTDITPDYPLIIVTTGLMFRLTIGLLRDRVLIYSYRMSFCWCFGSIKFSELFQVYTRYIKCA